MEIGGLVFAIILIVFISFSELKEKNKEIKKLRKDWQFCKSLLDDARSVLTEEQKEKLKKIYEDKNNKKRKIIDTLKKSYKNKDISEEQNEHMEYMTEFYIKYPEKWKEVKDKN